MNSSTRPPQTHLPPFFPLSFPFYLLSPFPPQWRVGARSAKQQRSVCLHNISTVRSRTVAGVWLEDWLEASHEHRWSRGEHHWDQLEQSTGTLACLSGVGCCGDHQALGNTETHDHGLLCVRVPSLVMQLAYVWQMAHGLPLPCPVQLHRKTRSVCTSTGFYGAFSVTQ